MVPLELVSYIIDNNNIIDDNILEKKKQRGALKLFLKEGGINSEDDATLAEGRGKNAGWSSARSGNPGPPGIAP